MRYNEIKETELYNDIMEDPSPLIFGEGTTNAGKSFIFGLKTIWRVINSPENQNQFVIAGKSLPVLEKMYIQNNTSFYNIDVFNAICKYKNSGTGGARIEVSTLTGVKNIYLLGYDNKRRWTDILGLTLRAINVEEITIADDEFITEAVSRAFRNGGWLICSSNGADPEAFAYTEYLNHARPLDKYIDKVPKKTWDELNSKAPKDGFRYYFFDFNDNPTMTEHEKTSLIDSTPLGSYQYTTKILGLRGIREGVIYAEYMSREKNIIHLDMLSDKKEDIAFLDKHGIEMMTIGQDVGGTDNNEFVIKLFTRGFRHVIDIDFIEFNDVDFDTIWERFYKFFMPYWQRYSQHFKGNFIDSAAKIMRLSMDRRMNANIGIRCYKAYKYRIVDRCDYGIRILDTGRKLFTQKTEKIYVSFTKAFYNNSNKTDIRDFSKHVHKDRVDASEYGEANYIAKMVGYLKPVS